MFKLDLEKAEEPDDPIANICWIIEKAREFQKNIYFGFIDYTKAFDGVDHNKLWKNFQEMGIPDHLNCLLRNLYAHKKFLVHVLLKPSLENIEHCFTSMWDECNCVIV